MDYDRFGPYALHECLGTGGMATVYRATIEQRDIAIKRLLPQLADDRLFVEAFVREARLAAQLHHPNIVEIYELGQIAGTHFIEMELVRGVPLVQLMTRAAGRPAPIGVILAIVLELCDALQYAAHGTDARGVPFGIIHRDVTPSNVMITDDGRVKIIDFGVARAMTGAFTTNTGMVKGKLGYMSVEALQGAVLDGRTDLFSVGVVAWELLTGRRLFRGANELELITKIKEGKIYPPSSFNASCPRTLDDAILRALARRRDERWGTAAELGAALDGVRRALGVSATHEDVAHWRRAVETAPLERAGPTQVDRHELEVDAETTLKRRADDVVVEVRLPDDGGDDFFTSAHRAPEHTIAEPKPKFLSSDTIVDRRPQTEDESA